MAPEVAQDAAHDAGLSNDGNDLQLGAAGTQQKVNFEEALDALLAGQPLPQTETSAFGCTIKR